MVTHWKNHWDNIPNNETYFSKKMLKQGMTVEKIQEDTYTIFIRRNEQTKQPEKAWEGSVYDFKIKGDKIYFKVKIDREIQIPPEYINYTEGWYVEDFEGIPFETVIYPPFFYVLTTTKDYEEFERYTCILLKLLGIHHIFRYEKQSGQPDGFFKFGNLAVIYDTTLRSDYQEVKETQIQNYAAMLKTGVLKYEDRTINVANCKKQVWIITRGISRTISKTDDVTIKEIPISRLIKIYSERVKKLIDDVELENMLINL